MERRINTKTRQYLLNFKNDIRAFVQGEYTTDTLLQFVYDYQPLQFEKVDFQKRKRVKNVVPFFERCRALRANGEQCTRRKKCGEHFCGTHIKGIPHGEISNKVEKVTHTHKTVWAQDIKGIIYYIDDESNVYHPQDVMNNSVNPKIIAKYQIINGKYVIPDLFKK